MSLQIKPQGIFAIFSGKSFLIESYAELSTLFMFELCQFVLSSLKFRARMLHNQGLKMLVKEKDGELSIEKPHKTEVIKIAQTANNGLELIVGETSTSVLQSDLHLVLYKYLKI